MDRSRGSEEGGGGRAALGGPADGRDEALAPGAGACARAPNSIEMPPSPTQTSSDIRCGRGAGRPSRREGACGRAAPLLEPTPARRSRQVGELRILGGSDRRQRALAGAASCYRRAWRVAFGAAWRPSVDAPRVRAYHGASRDPIPWSPFLRVGARTLRTEQCAKSQCVYPVDLGRCGSPCLPARRSYETAPQEGRSGCAARGGRLSNNEPETGLHGRVQRFSTESLILAQDERWRRA